MRLRFMILFALLSAAISAQQPQSMSLDELLRKHLDAIGMPFARKALTVRGADGTVDLQIMQVGGSKLSGRAALATMEGKLRVGFEFPARGYPGEELICDSAKVAVATTSSTTVGQRSELGEFINRHPEVMKEGLFGGVLSTAWPLLDLEKRKAKLKYLGVKKLEGEELLEMDYEPKKNTDVKIRLFFDPTNYRHLATQYEYVFSPPLTYSQTSQTTRPQDAHFKILERFSDFQESDGVTLPRLWTIRYSVSPGYARELQWTIKLLRLSHKVKYPPEVFVPN